MAYSAKASPNLIPDAPEREAGLSSATAATAAGGLETLPIRKLGRVADAFPDGNGKIPNNPAVAAVLAAIFKGGSRAQSLIGGWEEGENGHPVYQHSGRRGGLIMVCVDPVTTVEGSMPTAEALWSLVYGLNPFTADVALAVLAQLCEPSLGNRPKYPLVESVRINADAILAYKGMRRWGAERRLLRERVSDEMERLRGLSFNLEGYPAWDPTLGRWNAKGVSTKGDRLFDIVAVEEYEESLTGRSGPIEVSWLVRAGQWAYWWMNAQGRVWVSSMGRVLLELDHRANRGSAVLAKKVGQHTALLGGALRGRTVLERRIDRLLADVGELPVPEARGGHWAGRVRDRFDEAMLALAEAGAFAAVDWPSGFGPGDPDRNKGWVDRWLAGKVAITLPEPPAELSPSQFRAIRRRRFGPKRVRRQAAKRPAETLDGARVRRTRVERSWSQATLARHLGVSASYLSQIETGKRHPSATVAAKLTAWVEPGANGGSESRWSE